jgi:hypothetical protein
LKGLNIDAGQMAEVLVGGADRDTQGSSSLRPEKRPR